MSGEKARKRRAVAKRDGDRCAYCGATEDLTLDHVLPRSKGGANAIANLQLLCLPCNEQKGGRMTDADHVTLAAIAADLRRSAPVPPAVRRPPAPGLVHHPRCDYGSCVNVCPVYISRT